MANRILVLFLLIILSSAGFVSLAAEESTAAKPEILRLKATYEAGIQKINDEDLLSLISEQEKILGIMKAVQKQIKADGRLDPALAIGVEIDRFTAVKRIETTNIAKYFNDIEGLYNSYRKAVEKLPADRARKIITLVQGYDKALNSLQESYTKKNEIDNALAVKTERDALANNEDAASAKKTLADYSSAKTPEKPPEKIPEVIAVKPNVDPKSVEKKKYTGSSEKRIRQRFDDLSRCVLKNSFVKASEAVEPEMIKRVGFDGVRRLLMRSFDFDRYGRNLTGRMDVKMGANHITVAEDDQNAILTPRIWVHNKWVDLPDMNWIQCDGDWYADLSEVEEKMMNENKSSDGSRWHPPPGRKIFNEHDRK